MGIVIAVLGIILGAVLSGSVLFDAIPQNTVIVLAVVLNNGFSLLVRQFVHPFKVPTGAMQPTIFGIHGHDLPVDSSEKPGMIQWLLSGQQHVEVRAKSSGVLSAPRPSRDAPARWTYTIGPQQHELPRFARPLKQPGEHVSAGDTLWSGVVVAGDHLFVERLSYRFGKPKRGDIVVFRTKGIETLPPNTFYIKRVAGLPGERIRIEPPRRWQSRRYSGLSQQNRTATPDSDSRLTPRLSVRGCRSPPTSSPWVPMSISSSAITPETVVTVDTGVLYRRRTSSAEQLGSTGRSPESTHSKGNERSQQRRGYADKPRPSR